MERKAFHGSFGVGSNLMTAHAYVWRDPNPPASLPKEFSSWSKSQHSLILQGQPWSRLFQICLFSPRPIPGRWSNLTSIFFKSVGSTTIQWWVFSSISVWNKQQVGHILWNGDCHQNHTFSMEELPFWNHTFLGCQCQLPECFNLWNPQPLPLIHVCSISTYMFGCFWYIYHYLPRVCWFWQLRYELVGKSYQSSHKNPIKQPIEQWSFHPVWLFFYPPNKKTTQVYRDLYWA